ncbi:MAG: hypothetical protein LBH84_09550 [Prevotellaceae bacterium]|jgi:hypothetical protein|nr:hypothetical protein [Prevotellaceae bacterium]
MKKWKLMLAGMAVAMATCQKEKETDFERGKKDGKAFCDCMTTAGLSGQLCLSHIDLNQLAAMGAADHPQISDYVAGLLTAPCMFEYLALLRLQYPNMPDVADAAPPAVIP